MKNAKSNPEVFVSLFPVAFSERYGSEKQPGRSILTFSVALGVLHVQIPLFQICPGIYVIYRLGNYLGAIDWSTLGLPKNVVKFNREFHNKIP